MYVYRLFFTETMFLFIVYKFPKARLLVYFNCKVYLIRP